MEDDIIPLPELAERYSALLSQLHNKEILVRLEDLLSFQFLAHELLVFAFVENECIATAQGTLSKLFPIPKVHIENVIVFDAYRGRGYGHRLIEALLMFADHQWRNRQRRSLRFELTNSPGKANVGFWRNLGFRPRSPESEDLTVVWGFEF